MSDFEPGMRVVVKPKKPKMWVKSTSRLETLRDDRGRIVRLPALATVVAVQFGWAVRVRLDGCLGTHSFRSDSLAVSDIISEIAFLAEPPPKRFVNVRPPAKSPP